MADPVFFEPARRFSAGELAAAIGATLADVSSAAAEISNLASLEESRDGALVFINSKKHADLLGSTRAAAVICKPELAGQVRPGVAALLSEHPQRAFATAARLIYPQSVRPEPLTGETGISPAAIVAEGAQVEAGAIVEATAVIGPGAAVGSGTIVAPGAVIGRGCQVGRDCYIGPGVSLQTALIGNRVFLHGGVRVGQDGFGYVPGARGAEKVPQIGRVVIQDDVEIGANTTVDRGAIDDTVIGEGTKIDNLVQIAHNVRIGRWCLIAGRSGLAGSVVVGDFVLMGGAVGIIDHATIGSGAQLAANAAVMHDVPAGAKWAGAPAQPVREFFREVAAIRALAANGRDKKGGGDD